MHADIEEMVEWLREAGEQLGFFGRLRLFFASAFPAYKPRPLLEDTCHREQAPFRITYGCPQPCDRLRKTLHFFEHTP